MKTFFKPLFFAILVIAALRGFSQCQVTNFNYSIGGGGVVSFENYNIYYDSLSQPDTYIWNFGDGDTSHSGNFSVSHTYSSLGTYTVTLEVINTAYGCDTTFSQTFYINLCSGYAQYAISQIGFGEYFFDADNLIDVQGPAASWNFGDGTTSNIVSPVHQYTASGNYDVSLIITVSALGCADTVSGSMQVTLCNFPVSIVDTIESYNPVVVDFATAPSNQSYSYSWSYGDSGIGSGQFTTHTYTTNGQYAPSVTISDGVTGCSTTAYTNLNINLCGIAYANIGNSGDGFTQSFNANAQVDSTNVSISGYQWTFPGASPVTGSGSQVSGITYPGVGTYSACAYITTNIGCIDTICETVIISAPVYNINGTVSTSTGSSFTGVVYLIVQDSVGHLALSDSIIALTDSGSFYTYSFNNVAINTYYVKAALSPTDPNYANFLPTYFGNVLTWGTATPVVVSTVSTNPYADIQLIEGNNSGGPGFVGGYVSQGAGLVLGGTGNANAKSLGDPLQNVQINLLTSTDQPVAYTYTDANGKYSFANLALGSYQIYAEQLNKIPNPISFTLTAENPTDSGANISINSRTATGIDNITGLQITEVYPNPVIAIVQLQIGCTQNVDATLKLVDILGRTTLEQSLNLVTGQNTAEVNMATLAAGVYQLVIQSGSKQVTYKLVKAK